MGVVYTESAIKNGEVPNLGDFQTIVTVLREGFVALHKKYPVEVPAVTFFGSVAAGSFTICSDIDIIVLFDDSKIENDFLFDLCWQSKQYLWALAAATKRHIRVSVYPVVLSDLRSESTKDDRQFLGHVCKAALGQGLICGDPQTFLDFSHVAPMNNVERTTTYIDRKIEKIKQRLFCYPALSEDELARMYLDTYQAPFHALRRYFDLQRKSDHEDSKNGLIEAFATTGNDEIVSALSQLRDGWRTYVEYVQRVTQEEIKTDNKKVKVECSPLSVEDTKSALFVLRCIRKLAEMKMVWHQIHT